jgi:SAM-dependent methyltransferase
MSADMTTSYDSVLYPGRTFRETHPDRLATLAALYGMAPAAPARCRVLELGCGHGSNLIPMAYQYPESEFLGIDLGREGIEAGRRSVAALALPNIELRHADILEFTAARGGFDYIIAHGVYSWVPAAVRERVLAIFHDNLAPQGVAYVSYNAHPISHLRDIARGIMLFHVRDIADPQQRIAQARAILKFCASASASNSVHGAVLRDQLNRVAALDDEVLFHDDLEATAEAFFLHQVVAAAGRHDLQYLCEATLSRRDLQGHPEGVRAFLAQFPDTHFMERDQYQDFIEGHAFRRTLLCHRDVALERKLAPDLITRFHLASSAEPVPDDLDLGGAGLVAFKTAEGGTFVASHRLTQHAIRHLGASWPAAIGFAELVETASRHAAAVGDGQPDAGDAEVAMLVENLFRAACSGRIELHLHPPRLTTAIGERPQASLLARKQALSQRSVTNLLHRTIVLEGDDAGRLLQLVDGNRDIDQLVVDFSGTLADVQEQLRLLARQGLLIG